MVAKVKRSPLIAMSHHKPQHQPVSGPFSGSDAHGSPGRQESSNIKLYINGQANN